METHEKTSTLKPRRRRIERPKKTKATRLDVVFSSVLDEDDREEGIEDEEAPKSIEDLRESDAKGEDDEDDEEDIKDGLRV